MIRDQLVKRGIGFDKNFRMRGEEASRVEAFSDAVFAFAITLTVVSLEIPKTFDDLQALLLYGSFSFAICFALLVQVWFWHYTFFRRFGLQDAFTIFLNMVLLFVILLYIYPLKFLFTLAVNQFFGVSSTAVSTAVIKEGQVSSLMIIYSAAYVAVTVIFLFLYVHAYRRRVELDLNALELHRTQGSMLSFILLAGIGVSSILLAAFGGVAFVSWSGWIYLLIGPVLLIGHTLMGRRWRKQQELRTETSDTTYGRDAAKSPGSS